MVTRPRSGKCQLCQHPDRYRAEMLLAGGASVRSVVQKLDLGLSGDSVWRHWTRHINPSRKAQLIAGPLKLHQLAERAAEEGLSLLDYLQLIRTTLLSQFTACAEAGDNHSTALLSGRLMECLRLIAQMTGELGRLGGPSVTTNVMIMQSPVFVELQQMLLQRLAPYPEARASVLAGLQALDRRMGTNAMPATQPPLIEGAAA